MSLVSSNSLNSESVDSVLVKTESRDSENIFMEAWQRHNPEGFSSSLILNIDNDIDKKLKPCSKLVNIIQVIPGTEKTKKVMLPIFYRKSVSSNPSKNLLYLEQNITMNESNDSLKEGVENRQEVKNEVFKENWMSMKDFDRKGKMDDDNFIRKGSFDSGSGIKLKGFGGTKEFFRERKCDGMIFEGNLVAYCHKCKKETVTVMQQERFRGFKGLKELLLCCCSSLNTNGKNFACPVCLEILLKIN
ncbi:hypothetical protein SteCoe_11081 [Stentor coeruleus]|uniref:Uncharacterized protein n=1 Tax=Stentor coeruleus TaxID=5963 RepID=A0A1R2CE00_9CILI|nr:hypothetical protein SteCoe_11081 [Stentor coeruleus]